MAIEINVPDIGSDEVEVTEVMVNVGDTVEAEQSLITVEGDKASMEVPSPQAGVVKEIKIAVGDKVSTGSLIMVFDSADSAAEAPAAAQPEAAPAAPAAASAVKEVEVPDIGGDEVEVTEVMVNVGDSVGAEQSLITVEGDKASMEVPAPFAGVVKEIKIATGDKVKTGSLIMSGIAEPQAVRQTVVTVEDLFQGNQSLIGYRALRDGQRGGNEIDHPSTCRIEGVVGRSAGDDEFS